MTSPVAKPAHSGDTIRSSVPAIETCGTSLDEAARADLTTLLYGAHLMVLLVWLVDRAGGSVAEGLVDAAAAAIKQAMPYAASPMLQPSWRGAAGWVARFLGDRPQSATGRSS